MNTMSADTHANASERRRLEPILDMGQELDTGGHSRAKLKPFPRPRNEVCEGVTEQIHKQIKEVNTDVN